MYRCDYHQFLSLATMGWPLYLSSSGQGPEVTGHRLELPGLEIQGASSWIFGVYALLLTGLIITIFWAVLRRQLRLVEEKCQQELRRSEITHSTGQPTTGASQTESAVMPGAGSLAKGAAQILVVEDDPTNLEVVLAYLASGGFSPTAALSGEMALKKFTEKTFDMILLDMALPRLSGGEICRSLRQRFAMTDLPIIFLSGMCRDSDIEEALAQGANDYLRKPISKSNLLARVRFHLEMLEIHRKLKGDARVAESQMAKLSQIALCPECSKSRVLEPP